MTREEAVKILIALWGSDFSACLSEEEAEANKMAIEALQEPETATLTYDEKCIFLAAIGRERRICKEMDEEPELKAKPLVPIVDEIERKVKAVLWGENNG